MGDTPAFKNELEKFDKSRLKRRDTDEKNTLPTAQSESVFVRLLFGLVWLQ